MKDECEATIMATHRGIEHVWEELTPDAQSRILTAIGHGELRGSIYIDDFKRGR